MVSAGAIYNQRAQIAEKRKKAKEWQSGVCVVESLAAYLPKGTSMTGAKAARLVLDHYQRVGRAPQAVLVGAREAPRHARTFPGKSDSMVVAKKGKGANRWVCVGRKLNVRPVTSNVDAR